MIVVVAYQLQGDCKIWIIKDFHLAPNKKKRKDVREYERVYNYDMKKAMVEEFNKRGIAVLQDNSEYRIKQRETDPDFPPLKK